MRSAAHTPSGSIRGWKKHRLTALALLSLSAFAATIPDPRQAVLSTERAERAGQLSLEVGQVQSLPGSEVTRVAIGDPAILDVSVVTPNELLLQAKRAGLTNLIVWDRRGQRVYGVEATDRQTFANEQQLSQLIRELNLTNVRVKREQDKVFLVGEVSRQEDFDRLEQLVEAYGDKITNLVALTVTAPSPLAVLPQLVRLSVQVIELNRSDVEQLGVSWSREATISESTRTGLTGREALFRWGTDLTRSQVSATINALVRKNRARILAEPKLVTASNKQASSFIGLEVPILTGTEDTEQGSASTNVQYRKTGVVLTMTPIVHIGGQTRKVTTSIEAEISGIDTASAIRIPTRSGDISIPGFKIRKATTEVTTDSGETIVIAGLLEAEDSSDIDQVPALGSIPVLGRLFKSPELSSTQREIVIAVTPEVLGGEDISTDRLLAIEQALGNPSPPTAQDAGLARYANEVQARLAEGIGYPEQQASGASGRVLIRLRIRRDGALGDAQIAESSGTPAFDEAALLGARRIASYPPFPDAIGEQDLLLDVPVIFNPAVIEEALGLAFREASGQIPNQSEAMQRYAQEIQSRIARFLKYPEREMSLGAGGQVLLRLLVARNGSLEKAEIVRSSGIATLDRAALEAASQQAPFPPFFPEIPHQEVLVDVPVVFSPTY